MGKGDAVKYWEIIADRLSEAGWSGGCVFILPDRKELIFRLYFVDTPEEERVYADRIAEQAAYFGITPDAAIQIGREASEFTKHALTKPFTIYTRWRRALGRSAIWRYYAIVVTADGCDLNELIPTGECSGLQTRIATTESVSLYERMKS
jgi:hypothetical protein